MSYETYHKITQLENGDFIVTSKCSNDGCPPKEWTMDYYRREYPFLNYHQREAVFVLTGLYYGNCYYQSKFKRLEKLASDYSKAAFTQTGEYAYNKVFSPMSRELYKREAAEHDPPYEEYYEATKQKIISTVDDFLLCIENTPHEKKVEAKIKLNLTNDYVSEMRTNSKHIGITPDCDRAKVFRVTKAELDALIAKIPKRYQAEAIMYT